MMGDENVCIVLDGEVDGLFLKNQSEPGKNSLKHIATFPLQEYEHDEST